MTESLWILEHLAGQPCPFPQYRRLFAADGLPKAERQRLPDLPEVLAYLTAVRNQVWEYLAVAPLDQQLRLWCWLLQHESQHAETISIVLSLHRQRQGRRFLQTPGQSGGEQGVGTTVPPIATDPAAVPMVAMPALEIPLGYNGPEAIDNEQVQHQCRVEDFWIDTHPVTCRAYGQFMAIGGYDQPAYWSEPGWRWRQQTQAQAPHYWNADPAWADHPVCGVNYYEAEAYARFVGKRLPTEAEWERTTHPAAVTSGPPFWGQDWLTPDRFNYGGLRGGTTPVGQYAATNNCYDLLGNVWEWTSSWFEAYPGFTAFPYRGYSQVYFDGGHRVLRGGSWATRPWALRPTVRNWYHPQVRQMLAGFRCARSA